MMYITVLIPAHYIGEPDEVCELEKTLKRAKLIDPWIDLSAELNARGRKGIGAVLEVIYDVSGFELVSVVPMPGSGVVPQLMYYFRG